jgi:hypothetical protein
MSNAQIKALRSVSPFPGGSSFDRARGRGTVALAGFVVGGILLAGCSGSSSGADQVPSDTVSPSTSDSATPTPIMTSYGTIEEQKRALPKSRDGMQTGAIMGRAVAANSEEAAVADAWLRYWQVRAKAFMEAKLDPAARDSVATGEAAAEITRPTNDRRKKKVYTRGTAIFNPTRIAINGNTAVLLDCMLDDSRDVYPDGTVEQKGINSYGIRAVLKKSQGTWRTDSFSDDQKLCSNEGMEQG